MKARHLIWSIVLILSWHITSFAQNFPAQILSAPEDSLPHYIEKSKHIIQTGIIAIPLQNIAGCGVSCYQRGEIKAARDFFEIAKHEYHEINDSTEIGRMLSNIAVTYELEGKYDQATDYYHQALDIFSSSGDKESQAKVYNNLGVLFQEINEETKALKYHKLSLNSKRNLMDTAGLASTYNNLGVLYEENFENSDSALYFYEKSLHFYRLINTNRFEAQLLSNIASIYVKTNRIQEAINMLEEAEWEAEKVDNIILKSRIYKNTALAHLKSNNLAEAELYIKKGLAISKAQNLLKPQIEFLNLTAELQEKKQNYQACIVTLHEKSQLKDS